MSLGGLQSLPSSQCFGSCFVFSEIISIPKESGGTVGSPKNSDVPSGGAGVSWGSAQGSWWLWGGDSVWSQLLYVPLVMVMSLQLFAPPRTEGFPPPAPNLCTASHTHLELPHSWSWSPFKEDPWGSSLAFPAPLTASPGWDAGWESDAPLHVPGTASLHRESQRVLLPRA